MMLLNKTLFALASLFVLMFLIFSVSASDTYVYNGCPVSGKLCGTITNLSLKPTLSWPDVCREGKCVTCTNGRLDPGEQCDDGNYQDANDHCTNNCTLVNKVVIFIHGIKLGGDGSAYFKTLDNMINLEFDNSVKRVMFTYDSGNSNKYSANLFNQFLYNLNNSVGGPYTEFYIITHSNGGLVSREAVLQAQGIFEGDMPDDPQLTPEQINQLRGIYKKTSIIDVSTILAGSYAMINVPAIGGWAGLGPYSSHQAWLFSQQNANSFVSSVKDYYDAFAWYDDFTKGIWKYRHRPSLNQRYLDWYNRFELGRAQGCKWNVYALQRDMDEISSAGVPLPMAPRLLSANNIDCESFKGVRTLWCQITDFSLDNGGARHEALLFYPPFIRDVVLKVIGGQTTVPCGG